MTSYKVSSRIGLAMGFCLGWLSPSQAALLEHGANVNTPNFGTVYNEHVGMGAPFQGSFSSLSTDVTKQVPTSDFSSLARKGQGRPHGIHYSSKYLVDTGYEPGKPDALVVLPKPDGWATGLLGVFLVGFQLRRKSKAIDPVCLTT